MDEQAHLELQALATSRSSLSVVRMLAS